MRRFDSGYVLTLLAGLSATAAAVPAPAQSPYQMADQQAQDSKAQDQQSVPAKTAQPASDGSTAYYSPSHGSLASSTDSYKRENCPSMTENAEDDTEHTGDARIPVNCKAAQSKTGAVIPTVPVVPAAQPAIAGDPLRQAEVSARAAALQNSRDNAEEPQSVRARVPYNNMPALRDLYTQVPSAGGTLRRFGSDAFLFGTGNANQLPSDLPVGPDYVLGPGDQLVVNLWGSHSERLNISVDRQGQIALPEAGTLVVNGMTVAHAQEALQKALNTQFKDEHAEISMGRLRMVRVYVAGDVQRPGAYDVSALSTPLSVLYAAGGPTARGSLRLMKQMRGDKAVAEVDLYDFLLKGVRSAVEHLQPGDTLVVPPVGPQVTVEGAVHHPAIYELNGEKNLKQVLDLAGGLLPTANLQAIEISRVEANARRTMLDLELPPNPAEASKALDAFHVQGHDGIVVGQILPYNQQAVYLAGHVFRPGQYAYRQGLTLTDLLHSYQDVLPEPAERGQVIRLVAPDLHPDVIPFHLQDVLLGNTPIALQPFDTVEIFGRYETDAPRVRIEGEVLRPGLYPLSAGMTVSGLVELAGGLNRSAYRDTAGLTSYAVVNGQSVEAEHTEVALADAVAGKPSSNPALKPGDVLSIRQITGWRDIGASITVTGEVAHPGGYGLVAGEHLSSVIRRAGGLRADAYPEAANFARVQVQVLGEQARLDMIQRLESAPLEVKPGAMSSSDQQQLTASLQSQRLQLITALKNHPASGRMVVNLTGDVSRWEGTPDDIVLRAGDTLNIPKRPDFVLISGQVYNPTAVSFAAGHDAGWYLGKGGGATRYGDNKRVYVLRADGSVITHKTFGNVLHVRLQPGDAVVVPEKLITGSGTLRDVLATAQIVTSLALTAAVAGGL